tara:strand:+ start:849 stop:1940 length:1092 start_codon:yes stop_codon:yes gene_type:complete
MAGYYDPYTEEWIESTQETEDFYKDYDYGNAVDYFGGLFPPVTESDPNNYGYDYYNAASDPAPYNDYSSMFAGDDDFATGSTYNDDGTLNYDLSAVFGEAPSDFWDTLGGVAKTYGSKIFNAAKGLVTDKNGQTDWGKIAGIAGGLASAYSSSQPKPPTGYQGKIPDYTAVRQQVENTYDPDRRPGSSGQRYFTGTQFTGADGVQGARDQAATEAAGLAALNAGNPAKQARPQSATENAIAQAEQAAAVEAQAPASSVIDDMPVPTYAAGGIANLAKGGEPRYLSGQTDGMADKIKANINGTQEARLSDGEFVVPADVVSHLGNGNSEAGAERLYTMMDRIRKARTGTKKQGKQINPDKYLAA